MAKKNSIAPACNAAKPTKAMVVTSIIARLTRRIALNLVTHLPY